MLFDLPEPRNFMRDVARQCDVIITTSSREAVLVLVLSSDWTKTIGNSSDVERRFVINNSCSFKCG